MELLAAKFNGIITSLKKKTYDFLDQRRTEFDTDYEDFKRVIQDLHVNYFTEN
jgi:dynein heavy chain, axonemal